MQAVPTSCNPYAPQSFAYVSRCRAPRMTTRTIDWTRFSEVVPLLHPNNVCRDALKLAPRSGERLEVLSPPSEAKCCPGGPANLRHHCLLSQFPDFANTPVEL